MVKDMNDNLEYVTRMIRSFFGWLYIYMNRSDNLGILPVLSVHIGMF